VEAQSNYPLQACVLGHRVVEWESIRQFANIILLEREFCYDGYFQAAAFNFSHLAILCRGYFGLFMLADCPQPRSQLGKPSLCLLSFAEEKLDKAIQVKNRQVAWTC
jgi:hypothetical protein